jgi:hypothetical protein
MIYKEIKAILFFALVFNVVVFARAQDVIILEYVDSKTGKKETKELDIEIGYYDWAGIPYIQLSFPPYHVEWSYSSILPHLTPRGSRG